jgi:hypothetical protein
VVESSGYNYGCAQVEAAIKVPSVYKNRDLKANFSAREGSTIYHTAPSSGPKVITGSTTSRHQEGPS